MNQGYSSKRLTIRRPPIIVSFTPPPAPMSGDPDYKECPDCGEMVRTKARKCRFCGYRFEGGD